VVGAKATCSITGKANVCINAKNIKYTAPSGLTGYSWSITGNGTINGSSTGSSVLVNAGSVGYYTLTLSVTNGGCTCTCSKKVYVNPNPTCSLSTPYPLPVASSTNNHLCATVSSGITKYTWTVKGTGWSITGGQGTSCVTYTAGAAGSSGTFTLKVTGKAGCTCTCKVTFKASGNTYSQTTSPAVAGDEKADAITVNAYPNPYRNEIKFRFVSPKAGNATLEIYDLVGKKLAIVFNGKVDAGIEQTISYNVPLNGRVPVIYKLTIGDKMLHGMLLPEK